MNVIYVGQKAVEHQLPSIFLAGPSPRREHHPNWRPEAISLLNNFGFNGNVFVPLTENGGWLNDPERQIEWELLYLEVAKVIVFWIPRDIHVLPGFTTNVEFGMFVKSGKIVLGFPPTAHKMGYLEFVGKKWGVPISSTLGKTLNSALDLLERS